MSRESADMITDLILMLLGEENNVYKSVWVSTFRLSLQCQIIKNSGKPSFYWISAIQNCSSERGIRTPLGYKKSRKFNVFQRACLQKSRKVTDLCSTFSKQNNQAIDTTSCAPRATAILFNVLTDGFATPRSILDISD